jgi:hypothetical protein
VVQHNVPWFGVPSISRKDLTEPSELGDKRFKMLDLFTVQQQQIH